MPRRSRVVVPGLPHHVTQRGSRREPTFVQEGDQQLYLEILTWCASRWGVTLWAYCLMDNHTHHIAVPEHADSLARVFGVAHSRYSREINAREGWRGHLWQERFFSVPMDAAHALNACRYVLQNPVRAGLVAHPCDWPHSSALQHVGVEPFLGLVDGDALARRVESWDRFLGEQLDDDEAALLRACTRSGRPYGSERFLVSLEKKFDRRFRPGKVGRPPKSSRKG